MSKVCFVSTSSAAYGLLTGEAMSKVGGAELQQTLIAACLREIGHEVCFLVHDFGQPDVTTNQQGITLIKTFGLKKPPLLLRIAPPLRLFRGLQTANADIYYQRNGGLLTGLVAAYCRARNRKFIFALASEGDVDGSKLKRGTFFDRTSYKYGMRKADVILAQTEHQQGLLQENFGRSSVLVRNMYEMPNPVSVERRFILWVGNFYSLKRPEMFLDVARKLPELKFVMIGRPMPSRGDHYERALKTAENLPNVEIRGPVPYADIGQVYSEALAFVCTSESEGFPNTFLDAWSRRVPVVSTVDPDGILGRFGLGFHCESGEEIVEALKKIVSDEPLRAEIGEKGYRYVEQNHAAPVVRAQYEALLESWK